MFDPELLYQLATELWSAFGICINSSNFKLQCTRHKNEASESILVLERNTLELKQKKKQTKKQKDDVNTIFEI